MTPVSPQEPDEKLLSTPFVPAPVNIDPVFLTAGPIWPEHAAAPVLWPGTTCCRRPTQGRGQPFLHGFRFSVAANPRRHTFRAILSTAATWLSNAAFCDNCGAREFPLIPLQPHASASSDSLPAHSLGRLALTPLAIFGRARLLQAAEESQFVVIPSEARDLLFAKCQAKSRFLSPQTPFGMTKREFFRGLFWSCRKR
jgi:hypothetical protein